MIESWGGTNVSIRLTLLPAQSTPYNNNLVESAVGVSKESNFQYSVSQELAGPIRDEVSAP